MAYFIRFFLLIMVFVVQQCYGQDTLVKYFVVDTILFNKDIIRNKLFDGKYFMYLLVKENEEKVFFEGNFYIETYPNLETKIRYLKGDSLNVGIIMDDKRSIIWLNHIEYLPDTIHIPKWDLIHNQLQDSVKTWVGYYHYIGDSMVALYKQKSREYVTNKKSETQLKSYSFILNNVSYQVQLTTEVENLVTWYHGYPSRKGEERRYKKEIRGRKNVKYNRFAVSVHKKQKVYIGRISL